MYYRTKRGRFSVTPLSKEDLQKTQTMYSSNSHTVNHFYTGKVSSNVFKICASSFKKAYPLTKVTRLLNSIKQCCLRKIWRSPGIKLHGKEDGEVWGLPEVCSVCFRVPLLRWSRKRSCGEHLGSFRSTNCGFSSAGSSSQEWEHFHVAMSCQILWHFFSAKISSLSN